MKEKAFNISDIIGGIDNSNILGDQEGHMAGSRSAPVVTRGGNPFEFALSSTSPSPPPPSAGTTVGHATYHRQSEDVNAIPGLRRLLIDRDIDPPSQISDTTDDDFEQSQASPRSLREFSNDDHHEVGEPAASNSNAKSVMEVLLHPSHHVAKDSSSSSSHWSPMGYISSAASAASSISSSVISKLLSSVGLYNSTHHSHWPLIPSQHNRNYYLHLLDIASSYEQWHAAAHQLDRLEGNETWKENPASSDYDYNMLLSRLGQMRKARESGDIASMIFLLRTSLSRNFGDMGNPALYSKSRVGTKKLIEDFIDEVNRQLKLIAESPEIAMGGNQLLNLDAKLEFFLNTRQAFGRTALLLSGGATLGLNHIGVIKALYECKLLPRIISGSSVGSLIAALVCSKTDGELFDYLHDENINLKALESADEESSLFFKLSRFIKHGVIFDVEVLKECIRSNIGDITFQEAYNRTRRILNITVSSSTMYEMPRLLNYLTAPNVLIWSAVAASCAIPFVYKSAPLMARDKHGNIVLWNPSGHRWIDGSVENDLPMDRLSEMFNVNHFIVCQVNPHVVPFLSKKAGQLPNRIVSSALFLAKSEFNHRLSQLIELEIFPTTLHHMQNILTQRYYGDITIVPDVKMGDYLQLISNPSKETLWDAVMRGEKATWPQVSIIRNHCGVELVLDDIIYRLRCRKLDAALSKFTLPPSAIAEVPSQSAAILNYRPSNNTSSTSIHDSNPADDEQNDTPKLTRSHSVGKGMNFHRFIIAGDPNSFLNQISRPTTPAVNEDTLRRSKSMERMKQEYALKVASEANVPSPLPSADSTPVATTSTSHHRRKSSKNGVSMSANQVGSLMMTPTSPRRKNKKHA
eukprot:Partr_v1_DN27830_c2_g1_i1_m23279 putative patatin-like phospholipase domain-containing protein